ncbi:MAG TPA: ATP-dependent metallopeptidase FtsH/Yme1/Tma family protein, partial [Nitrococcus sp.]|nr:ATP-dependent metallopeptidase FtsH/Yme1/Tma family protein [Nitrococcus sp.]
MRQPTPKRSPQSGSPERGFNWPVLFLIVGIIIVVFYWLGATREPQAVQLSYSQFKQQLQADHIEKVIMQNQNIRGLFTQDYVNSGQGPAKPVFTTTRPPIADPGLMGQLEKHHVIVEAKSTRATWWQGLLIALLPWVLIIGGIIYFSSRMQKRMMSSGPFSFGRSRARRYREAATGVTLDDVAGADNAKREIQEIIEYLKEPGRYHELGARIPKGVLLMGPPGVGKTLLARAVAGEASVPFYSISGSEFIEMFVGVGASRVRDMFNEAKKEAPAIIFIDELDSIGRARGTGLGGGHDEREQTLNQILSEMDGFTVGETVVVLAATNRPDVLDPALLRPGRFDRKIVMDRPHRSARLAILRVHTRGKPIADDVDLDLIASRTVGFSGADLQNLVNEAALLAGRFGLRQIDMECFNLARDKIVFGAQREEVLHDHEKEV